MEQLLIGYLLFALTTAFAAKITILQPVLERVEKYNPDNPLVETKLLTYIVFGCLSILVAPLIFIPTIFPSLNEVFKDTLYNTIKD